MFSRWGCVKQTWAWREVDGNVQERQLGREFLRGATMSNLPRRATIRSIQEAHPEVPRYTAIPREVWGVVEFVNGKSRLMGQGENARLAFEMADRLAKANGGMADHHGGSGFSLESNYSPYDPFDLREPNFDWEQRLTKAPKKPVVPGSPEGYPDEIPAPGN